MPSHERPVLIFLRLTSTLIVCFCLAACGAIADEMARDIAEDVSGEVAKQVGTAVVDGVATALAERDFAHAPESNAPATSGSPVPTTFTCERKTCGKMESCEEALYQLNECDNGRLDANNDGVPCESICDLADVLAATENAVDRPPTAIPAGDGETGPVTRVVDGDTIDVLLDGQNTRIRYLQMNTPERNEPCYRESTGANIDLVAGKVVRLVADVELVDPYDRLLRYVYVDDVLVNRVLVQQGYAEVVLYPPNDAHYDEFRALEAEAAAAGRGCHPTGIFDDGSSRR